MRSFGWILFVLGVFSDIFSVAPDHDKHDGCFIDEANSDWAQNKHNEKSNKTGTDKAKREQYNKDSCDVIEDFENGLYPHDFEG